MSFGAFKMISKKLKIYKKQLFGPNIFFAYFISMCDSVGL